eukprot:m.53675 g.53675  ORF g.53675 m.53675 type:complete len:82 (+) comp34275_c0_seq3:919-1164(+)
MLAGFDCNSVMARSHSGYVAIILITTDYFCFSPAREFVSGGGVMADVERRSMAVLKFKFFLFVAVFYIWYTTNTFYVKFVT